MSCRELLRFGGRGKNGTSFCRNIVPAKRNSWKITLGKKEHGKESFFLQELGSNSSGFLELKSKKTRTQKGMHNLGGVMGAPVDERTGHWNMVEKAR
jgi:hypothetical protein